MASLASNGRGSGGQPPLRTDPACAPSTRNAEQGDAARIVIKLKATRARVARLTTIKVTIVDAGESRQTRHA